MKYDLIAPLVLLACTAVSGCHRSGDAADTIAKGQVVASVNGHEITISELNAELVGRPLPTGADRRRGESAALQGLIVRTILADIARNRKLDQQPAYILQQHRANEILLSQNLQTNLAVDVTRPTEAEAGAYIAAHPELFAQRKIYALDQIKFRAPDDVRKLQVFTPLKTLAEIEQRLIEDRTPYQKAQATLDVLRSEPEIVQGIAKLPAGEVFLVPKDGAVYASLVTSTRTEPFTGPQAQNYAIQALFAQRIEATTVKALSSDIKTARATIKYQSGYNPNQLSTK